MRPSAKTGTFLLTIATLLHRTTFAGDEETKPLLQAVAAGRIDEVRAQLDAGAHLDERDSDDRTPLHLAAAAGHLSVAGLLLDRGADANAKARFDMTPLHWAAMMGRPDVVGLLARRGARTDARDVYGRTPLHLAADDKTVEVLSRAGAAIDAKDQRGQTPLHIARRGIVARALLDQGADLRLTTAQGLLPMQMAAIELPAQTGISVHGPMMARLRSLMSQTRITLTNVSDRSLTDLVLTARSPAASVDVVPPSVPKLYPGQAADFDLVLLRSIDAKPGEYLISLKMTVAGAPWGDFALRLDTTMTQTPEDQGMIRLAKGTLRPAPSRLQYLAYAVVPILVAAAWFLIRLRRKGAPPERPSN